MYANLGASNESRVATHFRGRLKTRQGSYRFQQLIAASLRPHRHAEFHPINTYKQWHKHGPGICVEHDKKAYALPRSSLQLVLG